MSKIRQLYLFENCPVCNGDVEATSWKHFQFNIGDKARCQVCSISGVLMLLDEESLCVQWDLDEVYEEAKIIGYNDLAGTNPYLSYTGDPLVKEALLNGYKDGRDFFAECEENRQNDQSIGVQT